jgi:hypothetical protein
VVELDEQSLTALDAAAREKMKSEVGSLFKEGGFDYPVTLAPYRTGSAFLVRLHQRDAA